MRMKAATKKSLFLFKADSQLLLSALQKNNKKHQNINFISQAFQIIIFC